MPCLKKLGFGDNCAGDAGARALADALTTVPNLVELEVADNGLSDIGLTALQDAAAVRPSLDLSL